MGNDGSGGGSGSGGGGGGVGGGGEGNASECEQPGDDVCVMDEDGGRGSVRHVRPGREVKGVEGR